ncbi:uncharacterized protein LOC123684477 [Harmonia axyridis]|uniref:uncharacterized protein LOC123684477 n=1 Tax=Harmonia axyridis TaxID=115357 RepID=UPI001E278BD1|nr:uncharacterized protein LOC123684477 [Harmonia axyridis]
MENVTLMSLNQMCDLALGLVNPGVIHFDILHQILRTIIQQCNLIDVKIKMQGEKSLEMQKFTSSNKRQSQVTLPSVKQMAIAPFPGSIEPSVHEPSLSTQKSVGETPSHKLDEKSSSIKEANVIVLDHADNKPLEHTVSISVEQMQWIIDSIEQLRRQVHEIKYLPANMDIIGSLRESAAPTMSGSSSVAQKPARSMSDTPIADMVQNLSLMKRLDAVEEAMAKLASLVEDLGRDCAVGSKERLLDVGSLSDLRGMSITALGNKNALELLTKEVNALKLLLHGEENAAGPAEANLHNKVATIEVRVKQIMDQVEVLDRMTSEQIGNLFGQCAGLEDAMSGLNKRVVDTVSDQKGPMEILNEKFKHVRHEVEKFKSDQQKLLDAFERKEMEMSVLMEQVEVLKTIAVTQDDFEHALEKKLDAELIIGKVSEEKFDKTYDELKINLDDAIARLTTQEDLWQKALIELQNEMVSKLEKNELIALQDFVQNKLKILRNKVRSMKMYQNEQEAAATKQMLLRNVKCLSCDADVAMKVKHSPRDFPLSPTLPPSRTIAPYLAYELDVIRKQQRGQAHSRNMHHFEASVRNKEDRVENRYCGGPHTVTTPVQRVTRMGNFMEQWGPEMASVNEKFIKGTDQKIYIGCIAEPIRPIKKQSAILVEGDIVRDRKSMHDVATHFPERDSFVSKGESERKSKGTSMTSDLRRQSSGSNKMKTPTKKSSGDRKPNTPVESAVGFVDANPDNSSAP